MHRALVAVATAAVLALLASDGVAHAHGGVVAQPPPERGGGPRGGGGPPSHIDPGFGGPIVTAGGRLGWRVEPRRVAYDLERIYEIYDTTGFLAAGGVTARLLRMELEHASPILVPFLEWARRTAVEPTCAALDRFLEVFQPGQSLRDFFRRLQPDATG